MKIFKVIMLILAGGAGTRMYPFTAKRPKPGVSFGARLKLVDIPLSNGLNSDISHIYVIVQNQADYLSNHFLGYHTGISQMRGEFINVLGPSGEEHGLFKTDADSILKLKSRILEHDFDVVVLCMADQIVKCDFRPVIEQLINTDADAAVVYKTVTLDEARGRLGVLKVERTKVRGFDEKPENPEPIEVDSNKCLANTAMYAMTKKAFKDMVNAMSHHHVHNKNLSSTGITWLCENRDVIAFNLEDASTSDLSKDELGYFADTGTIRSYFDTSMDLLKRPAGFNLYSSTWPIYTKASWPNSAAKLDCVNINGIILGLNTILQDQVTVNSGIVSDGVEIKKNTKIEYSILLPNSKIGENVYLKNVIVDEEVNIPKGINLSGDKPPKNVQNQEEILSLLKTNKFIPKIPVFSEGVLVIPEGIDFKKWKPEY